jgi:hypothetical protein
MHYPPDIDAAYESWGANCGPCALAAILDLPVAAVRDYFLDFQQRGYVNPTHMRQALERANRRYRVMRDGQRPQAGLLFVQWGGHEHRPIPAQYRHTHWIAIEHDRVFEVNAPELVPWRKWQQVMPRLMQVEKLGNGTFFVRTALALISTTSRHA